MVIVLIVTPQGFPLSYEVMPGNASDKTTLSDFLAKIEAHIFVAFIAYCLHVTLKNLARPRAPGLTPRAVLEKLSTMQLVDVHLPTTDGRHLVLPRHTDPTRDQQLLLHQLNLQLPEQPPTRIWSRKPLENRSPAGNL